MRPTFAAIRGPDRANFPSPADYALADEECVAEVREMLDRYFGVPYRSPNMESSRIAYCSKPTEECRRFCYSYRSGTHHICTRWPLTALHVPHEATVVTREVGGIEYETCDRFTPGKPKHGAGRKARRPKGGKSAHHSPRSSHIEAWLREALGKARKDEMIEVARAARGYLMEGYADDDLPLIMWLRDEACRTGGTHGKTRAAG